MRRGKSFMFPMFVSPAVVSNIQKGISLILHINWLQHFGRSRTNTEIDVRELQHQNASSRYLRDA